MKQSSLWEKRIPTIIGLILIIAGIGITSFLTNKGIIPNTGAAPSLLPQHVQISNVTDTSFTVTYTTDTSTVGSLSLEKNKPGTRIVLDDRDKNNNAPRPHAVHSFTLRNLSSNTRYYFSIISGNTTYINNNTFFSATTGPPLANTNSLHKTISGTVILPQDNQGEILVFMQSANGQLLSTVVNMNGLYSFSLENIRTNDLTRYAEIHDHDPVSVIVTDGVTSSHVLTEIVNAEKIAPVALAQDYNFIQENNQTAQTNNSELGFPAFTTQIANTLTIPAIISPKHNEAFVDQQPQFSGIARPNASVTIVIHSDAAIQTQVTADSTGQWTYRPDNPFSVGDHTISITTPDASGTMQTITQNFSIFPIGTQVFQTATPSATLTPTYSPTPTPTVKPTPSTSSQSPTPTLIVSIAPTVIPTTAPTAGPTPTNSPTPTLIMTPTPIQINIPSPTRPPLPSTGNPFIFPIGIVSILTTILGIGILIL